MKLSDIITPEKFRDLAGFISYADKKLGLKGTEIQDDLHKFASNLEMIEARNSANYFPSDLIREIEIHIKTTKECIENFDIPKYVKELLEQDIKIYEKILTQCKIDE